jgi:hypothetical protein
MLDKRYRSLDVFLHVLFGIDDEVEVPEIFQFLYLFVVVVTHLFFIIVLRKSRND